MPQIVPQYNDDRGRANREANARRLRNQRRRQQYQMARALQAEDRQEVSFDEQVRRRFSSEIVKDLRPLRRLLSVIALILMTGRRSLLTESTLLMTGSTSRACAQLRALIDPDYVWIDVMQPDFEKIDEPGFSDRARNYILKYVTYDEFENRAFLRRLRGDDFHVNDHALLFEIVNLIDNGLVDRVGRHVCIYEFTRVLPDSLLRAATAEYFCSKCNDIFITKKELRKHLHLMHKEDVEDAAPARNEVDDEENRYTKINRQARLKRQIYRMLNTPEKVLQYQKANRLSLHVSSEEHGESHYELTD